MKAAAPPSPPLQPPADNGFWLEQKWQRRFSELEERDQVLTLTIARIETRGEAAFLQLYEQLGNIRHSLIHFAEVTQEVQDLHKEMQEKRQEHRVFRQQESDLKQSLQHLTQQLTRLEAMQTQQSRHTHFWRKVQLVAFGTLALIVCYHVFFY